MQKAQVRCWIMFERGRIYQKIHRTEAKNTRFSPANSEMKYTKVKNQKRISNPLLQFDSRVNFLVSLLTKLRDFFEGMFMVNLN